MRAWFFPEFSTDAALRESKHRLADEVRRLVEAVALVDPARVEPADLATVARLVTQAADTLAAAPTLPLDAATGGPDTMPTERGPVTGRSNAAAAPLILETGPEGTRGLSTFGPLYDGGAGTVHGGVVAAALMDVLTCAYFAAVERPGHIGTLTVRFRSPIPVGAPLVYTAGVDRTEGRKGLGSGAVRVGEDTVVEGEAVFIAPRAH